MQCFQLVLPEYLCHLTFNVLFLFAVQFGSLAWNVPLLAYHAYRCPKNFAHFFYFTLRFSIFYSVSGYMAIDLWFLQMSIELNFQ